LYQGKAHEAEEEARQGLARNPDQFKLMGYLGEFLYYQGKIHEADRVLKRSIELRGRAAAPEAPVFLAFVQASRGQRDQIDPALLHYKRRMSLMVISQNGLAPSTHSSATSNLPSPG
jgi:predicted Zn-dependent protease